MTSRTVVEPAALAAELAVVRQRGYAECDEEQWLGVRSVAVPVERDGIAATFALGVQAPSTRLDVERAAQVAEVLKDTAIVIRSLPISSVLAGL